MVNAADEEGTQAGESMLAFEPGAVTDESEEWMDWCTMRINAVLGSDDQLTPAAAAPAGSQTETQDLLRLLAAQALLGRQVQGTAMATPTQGVTINTGQQGSLHMMKGKNTMPTKLQS